MLLHFFSEFLAVLDERTLVRPIVFEGPEKAIGALCSVAPAITFSGSTFCFTGAVLGIRLLWSQSKAVDLRRKGVKVVILHLNDLHDALLDA